eukprot:TRINITY_DN89368_c0_g1_i1.p2 TRINITY_DN89368_c0_g1~~TRINITY_DN89368_c0_g1_i1.p2  ORF type:complete len:164 (+),score=28.80 TRINITY_DN89368_c0_g1_i1:18-509(+)
MGNPTDFDSQDADWTAFGLPNYSKLVGQDLLQGWHHVQNRASTGSSFAAHCSRNFLEMCKKGYDYVCDTTEPTLHYRRDCGILYMFSPAEGTGWHTYKYMQGEPPAGCNPGEHCEACANPAGQTVCTVELHGGDCRESRPDAPSEPHPLETPAAEVVTQASFI